MKKVFISYPRTEQKFAAVLRHHLGSWHYETWIDIENIPKGAYWPDEIDAGLNSCDVVIGVISPQAMESRQVKNEWDSALNDNKKLLLLRREKCRIHSHYISINYIDFTQDAKQGFGELKVALEAVPPQDQHKRTVLPKGKQSERMPMLDQMHKYWIEGVLEDAISIGELRLGIAGQPHAVLHHSDYEDYILTQGMSIHEVFSKVGRELLILGNPGSGKTVALLQLARDLIKGAREDSTKPIPVILNLSTWTLLLPW